MKKFGEMLFKNALNKGFTNCELYFEKDNSFSVNVFGGEIYQYKNSKLNGVCFRGQYNGQMCYSYSEKVDLSIIDFLIDAAIINSEITNNQEIEEIFKGDDNYLDFKNYDEKLNGTSCEDKIQIAKEIEKYLFSVDNRVKSVNTCLVGSGETDISILNTLGLFVQNKSNYAFAYVSVVVEKNNQKKVGSEKWLNTNFQNFDYKKMCNSAVTKALKQIGASPIKSGSYPVIIENEAMGDLLETFASVFYGESVEKGFSLLKNKIGNKIANTKVTISDEVCVKNSINVVLFDSEGYATKNKNIVENGILNTFLHNSKTAKKAGVFSTGNGFKHSFKTSIGTKPMNFYINKGIKTIEELEQIMKNGVKITSLQGLHSGVNTISGDFSLMATGFLIKNGHISEPIDQITIAGNFYELLNDIEELGNDLVFSFPSGSSCIGSPSLLIKELNIGGV